ncbi:DUF2141 domain-containing protein [Sphingorhabdus contaminans]|uniref:DUF2141 domain-containing protein n=1 Tax=Sphingorhabdus contaminans TaxID=1343899 RepID=A0A553WH51_9SPHN|nr:DUF2141 domain-containing protein [Sphingorhabdus contaminans]
MGFTSGFGIKCAAPISVLGIGAAALLAGTALNATGSTSTLDVNIHGLRSMKGNVLVCVTANPKYFPDCSKDPKSYRAKVAARDAENVSFQGLAKGTYAVALIHDENANSKMDMAVFLPKEGFGFSRNPAVVTGPPKFKAAAFAVDADEVSQRVKMKYML